MTRRVAALLAMVAFAGAWLVGVWCHHAPRSRLYSAGFAALFGALAGAAIGFVLERIVLDRISERWDGGAGVAEGTSSAASVANGAREPSPQPAARSAASVAPGSALAEARR